MEWKRLKARVLEAGSVRLSGDPADEYVSRSVAGPSAGTPGSLFFSVGDRRVRAGIDERSPIVIIHQGEGETVLVIDREEIGRAHV